MNEDKIVPGCPHCCVPKFFQPLDRNGYCVRCQRTVQTKKEEACDVGSPNRDSNPALEWTNEHIRKCRKHDTDECLEKAFEAGVEWQQQQHDELVCEPIHEDDDDIEPSPGAGRR